MSIKEKSPFEQAFEEAEKEFDAIPSRSFYRYEPHYGIEKKMHKMTAYNMEGVSPAQRLAILNYQRGKVDKKDINTAINYPYVKKTYKQYGVDEVSATYGKFWKRLREQAKPCVERTEYRKEAVRRAHRAEAIHMANTMILKKKKYFSQLSKLI